VGVAPVEVEAGVAGPQRDRLGVAGQRLGAAAQLGQGGGQVAEGLDEPRPQAQRLFQMPGRFRSLPQRQQGRAPA
jgi:hypothetical protein